MYYSRAMNVSTLTHGCLNIPVRGVLQNYGVSKYPHKGGSVKYWFVDRGMRISPIEPCIHTTLQTPEIGVNIPTNPIGLPTASMLRHQGRPLSQL